MREISELVPAYIRDFPAYVPSRPDQELMRLFGVSRLHRLNNNENALGPPPAAQRVLAGIPPALPAIYPSGDAYYLREALGLEFSRPADSFLAGNGSCEIIGSVIKALCEPGDNIVTADKTFAVYEWVATYSGLTPKLAPLRGMALDPGALLDAVDERTKVLFLCNPNNPTGSWWKRQEMEDFLGALAGRCVVVIDEAYREYVADPDFPDGLELLDRYPNLLVFRTFSKIYGLAGLRVGYLCGSFELVDFVRRAQTAYSVNSLGQLAATAALKQGLEHILASRELAAKAKVFLQGVCNDLGLEHVCGAGNYLMLKTPISDTLLYRKLMQRGVMVRTMTFFRFPNWIRVSLAKDEAMSDFAQALRDILRSA